MYPVVHFEILGPKGEDLANFYREVFGWQLQEVMPDGGYYLVDTQGGKGFNGGIGKTTDGASMVTIYVAVPDPQAFLDKAVELGAAVVQEVTEIPDMVTFAQFRDTHGNVVGLVKDAGGGPQVSKGGGVPVTWFEIMGKDPSIQDFYRQLFDWKIADNAPAPGYGTVGWEEWGFGGGIGVIEGANQPYVTVYPEVADVDATCAAITSRDAEVVMGPIDMVEVGIRVCAFKDPQGNIVGAYKQIGAAT